MGTIRAGVERLARFALQGSDVEAVRQARRSGASFPDKDR